MADLTRIQFKRSKTPNVRPAPDTVAEGEIVLNLADRAILTKLGNEIIDLGFAKGGKVDGNIDLTGNFTQKNGNFNTTGNLNVDGTTTTTSLVVGNTEYSGIDIKQHTNRYLRLSNTAHGDASFAMLFKREADGTNLSSFKFPAGHGTAATREFVNSMIMTSNPSAPETIMRNPNGTNRLCLVVKDNGSAGAYDFANNRWAFIHNQAGFKVYGSGEFQSSGDYASISLKKSDNRYVQIETSPHAGSTIMLNFIYRDPNGANQHVIQMPYDSGILATREWTNTRFRRDSDGVVITPLDSNESGWWQHIKSDTVYFNNGTQPRLILSDSLMKVGMGISVKSNYADSSSSRVEVTAPDGQKSIGLWAYNDGRTLLSAYAGGGWSNITVGGVGNGTLATREWVNSQGFASQSWVNSQGFSKGAATMRRCRVVSTHNAIGQDSWGGRPGLNYGVALAGRMFRYYPPNGSPHLFLSNAENVLMGYNTASNGSLVYVGLTIDGTWLKAGGAWNHGWNNNSTSRIEMIEFY